MIKGILFDFDGTLSYRAASAYQMYRYLLSLLFPELADDSLVLEARVQRCMLWDEYGTIDKRHVLQMIREKWKPDMDIAYYWDLWYHKFCTFQVIMPGAYTVLEKLKAKYKIGMISNGDGLTQRLKIDRLKLAPYFDVIYLSGDFGVHKPDVRIYQAAAEALHLSCSEIAFIGDTFDTDILGAMRAGMLPLWYCYEHRGITDQPVRILRDFQDIAALFLENTDWNR